MKSFEGTAEPVGTRVLIKNMHFGEQKTASGLVIVDDDGTTRGIYPRWGQVHSKGPRNNDIYDVGDWILIEHGRWTRAMKLETEDGEELEVRMVDAECILAMAEEKPDEVQIGSEYADGEHATIDPSSFVRT